MFKGTDPNTINALSVVIGELLFVFVPFMVLLLVFIYQGKGIVTLLGAPEWAFASALLFGQTIVKLVTSIVEISEPPHKIIAERMGLFMALLIVLGLVPSMVVLALILVAGTPPAWLVVAQIALFALAVTVFGFFGMISYIDVAEYRLRVQMNTDKPADKTLKT